MGREASWVEPGHGWVKPMMMMMMTPTPKVKGK